MKILNIVAGLILHNNEILLIKRNKGPYKDWYAFPGGKIEFGETLKDAIKREIMEETNISLAEVKLLSIINERVIDKLHFTTYSENGLLDKSIEHVTEHFQIYYWIARTDNHIHELKHREGLITWFPLSNLPEKIIHSDRKIIDLIDKKHISTFECVLEKIEKDTGFDYKLIKWEKLS